MPRPITPAATARDLDATPARMDRRTAAAFLTARHFPISPRTLEAADLPWQHVNGRAVVETTALVAWAEAKLAAAPVVRGGRRKVAA